MFQLYVEHSLECSEISEQFTDGTYIVGLHGENIEIFASIVQAAWQQCLSSKKYYECFYMGAKNK